MPDLQTQLRVYGNNLDDLYPDVAFHEILERIAPPSRRRIPVRRGVVVALAVAIVILTFIGGVALLNLFGGSEPPVVTRPDSTTTSSPSTTGADSAPAPSEPVQTESISTGLGTWIWNRHEGSLTDLGSLTPPPTNQDDVQSTQPPGIPTPVIDGLTWQPGDGSAASLNGVTVTPSSLFGSVDWTSFFGENTLVFWDYASRMLNVAADTESTVLTVEVVTDVVEFRDIDTEELVLQLEATDPSVVVEQLTGEASRGPYWGPVAWSLHVDDGSPEWVEPPWQGLAVDFVRVIATPTNFVLVAVGRPPWEEPNRGSILWSWRSLDGRLWDQIGDPIQIDEIATGLELNGQGDKPIALLTGSGPQALGEANLLALVEESRWELVQPDIVGTFFVEGFGRMTSNWALAGFKQEQVDGVWVERCDVWLSGDGASWEQLSYSPDISANDGVTSTGCYLSGDTVVGLVDFEDRGIRWVGGIES